MTAQAQQGALLRHSSGHGESLVHDFSASMALLCDQAWGVKMNPEGQRIVRSAAEQAAGPKRVCPWSF